MEFQITEDLYAHNDTTYLKRTPEYDLNFEVSDFYIHKFPKHLDTAYTEDLMTGELVEVIDTASFTKHMNYLGEISISLLPALSNQLYYLFTADSVYKFDDYDVQIQDEKGHWHWSDYLDDSNRSQSLNEFFVLNKTLFKPGNIIRVSELRLYKQDEYEISVNDIFTWKIKK
jgi:hypothetical protein